MQDSFIRYLLEEKKLSLKTVESIQAVFGYADYETENKINDIINLLELCELEPNKYLLEYPEILDLVKIEDRKEFEEILEYIKGYVEKNKKNRNPYLLIHIILASRQILEKQKKEQTEMIIQLLRKEGLMGIFEPKINKSKAKVEQILHSEHELVRRNINILKREKQYKLLVYSMPLILINPNEKEVEKLLKEFQGKINQSEDKKEDEESKENKQEIAHEEEEEGLKANTEDGEFEKLKNNSNIKKENIINKEKKNSEKTIAGHNISLEEKKLLELGDEEKVLPILEAFNKYGINYEILNNNPEILRRTKIFNIPAILELLYISNIPFEVIYMYPEILQKGKVDEIAQIIDELKTRGISLTILLTYPNILIKTTPERIREIFIKIENNNIDKYMIYSNPCILVSGDIDSYIKSLLLLNNTLINDINEVVEILPNKHIVFEEVTNATSNSNDKEETFISKDAVSDLEDSKDILVITKVANAKKILNTLNDQGIDIEIIVQEPQILMDENSKIIDITEKIKSEKLGFGILSREPKILIKADVKKMEDILNCLKKYRPNTIKKIIKLYPQLIYSGNVKNMQLVFEQLIQNNIDLDFIDVTPQILLREDTEEITKVITKLNEKGYTKEDILKIPEILVRGKEQYIDRNFETFKRNDINIPLHLVHCISARNNEKNIDTLIENDLYVYIEKTPEILELKNSRLMQLLEIAKQNNIQIFKTSKNKETNEKRTLLNMEYFKLSDEQLSKKYELDMQYISGLGIETEKEEKKIRRVKNSKLYDAVYPILEKQAREELKDYEMNNVAYVNNGKLVSKQKVIRETYLYLETKAIKEGKEVLNDIDVKKMLTRKLNNLTRNNRIEGNKEREGGRSEKL